MFRLFHLTRCRIRRIPIGKSNSISTKGSLTIDDNTHRKWIEYQMTSEMNCTKIEIDHVKPIFMFDVSKDEELRECFNWKNTQPLLKQEQQNKGSKFIFLDCQLQFVKAYQFIKSNEEGYNEDVHR